MSDETSPYAWRDEYTGLWVRVLDAERARLLVSTPDEYPALTGTLVDPLMAVAVVHYGEDVIGWSHRSDPALLAEVARLSRIVDDVEKYVSEYEEAFVMYPDDPRDEPDLHRTVIRAVRAILTKKAPDDTK